MICGCRYTEAADHTAVVVAVAVEAAAWVVVVLAVEVVGSQRGTRG